MSLDNSPSSHTGDYSYQTGDFTSQSDSQTQSYGSHPSSLSDAEIPESESATTGKMSNVSLPEIPPGPARDILRQSPNPKQAKINDYFHPCEKKTATEKGKRSLEQSSGHSSLQASSDGPAGINRREPGSEKIKKAQKRDMGNFSSNSTNESRKTYHQSSWSAEDTNEYLNGYPESRKTYHQSSWSAEDTNEYLNGYPGKRDDKSLYKNLHFYQNRIPSYPDGDYIDNIHKKWYGKNAELERHHGYIQWLFPIRESGMNYKAQELQLHEAKAIKKDPEAKQRVLKSYKLMLHFYGMKLEDDHTGRINKAENWEERFRHLNRSFHNYLRITRILKSLGELGFEHLKYPFCDFVLREAMETKTLSNCTESCTNYWIHTLRNKEERNKITQLEHRLRENY